MRYHISKGNGIMPDDELKTFCIVPFIHSVVYTKVDIGYCCTAGSYRYRKNYNVVV